MFEAGEAGVAMEGVSTNVPPKTAQRSMATVLAAMADLAVAAREAVRWAPAERRRLLAELDRAVDGLTAVRATVLLAEHDAGTWRNSGDRSFEAWRSRVGRTTQRSAHAQVRLAEQLQAVPTAVEAVTAGRITVDHAAAIARVATSGTPAQQRAVRDEAARDALLELAARTDAGTFGTAVATWAAAVDPAALERDHQAQRRARHLHLSQTAAGTFLRGRLDTMAGHRLALALEALTPRPAPDDDRDPAQRRADALDAMAVRILADADTKPGAHVPPHVSLILTAETWQAARAERDRRRRSARDRCDDGGAPATPDREQDFTPAAGPPVEDRSEDAVPPATLEDGTPVPATELAMLLCDCAVTRIAIDADGAPLDLGRTARVFTGPQRRAVIARDRECIWPDCHMPARWCQIHHVRWWGRDGGATSVEGGVLLCSFHHHEVHRRDLAVVRLGASEPPQPGQAGAEGAPHVAADAAARAPVGTVARARYELRDRAGNLIGPRPGSRPQEARSTGPPSTPAAARPRAVRRGRSGTGAQDADEAALIPVARGQHHTGAPPGAVWVAVG